MSGAAATAAQRRTLDGLADVLIAAGAGKPSASEAGVSGELLDRALAVVPAWKEPLLAILDEAAGMRPAPVRAGVGRRPAGGFRGAVHRRYRGVFFETRRCGR